MRPVARISLSVFVRTTALLLAGALLPLAAQNPSTRQPRIGYVYPAGGQRGTTFQVSVGGQLLADVSLVLISAPGATARAIGYDRPLSQREFLETQEKLRQLQEKRAQARPGRNAGPPIAADGGSPEERRMATELRAALAKRLNRLSTPAVAETVTLEVTLPSEVPVGAYELRLRTAAGLTNALRFEVGDLPELAEPVTTATSNLPKVPGNPRPRTVDRTDAPLPARRIALPALVNGQILPAEIDRVQFAARRGQRVVVAASARALIPYLADAVPGWFQATLALYDGQGRELAYNDDYEFHPDPVLAYDIPADGDYTVEIKDALFRGREDFVYRLAVGELPFVTSIFPLGARAGESAVVELTGWNLEQSSATIDTANATSATLPFSAHHAGHQSNTLDFALGFEPEVLEAEPNDDARRAHLVGRPAIVNGRIQATGDVDVFRIDARRGETLVIEVNARRLNSRLDSTVTLLDDAGRQLGFNDDAEDRAAGLLTHHADSHLHATLPHDGAYFIRLANRQQRGGAEYGYRLRMGAPKPDFALRVTPASVNVRGGACAPLTVHAIRRDGFNGEIALALQHPPPGFALSGARIPAGLDKITLTIAAPPSPRNEPFDLVLIGTAKIGERFVVRTAVPADDQMQAFFYRHLVPASALKIAVTGRGGRARITSELPVRLRSSGTTRVQLSAPALRDAQNVACELVDPPEGVSVANMTVKDNFLDLELAIDAAKIRPGSQGNLLLNLTGERAPPPKQKSGVGRPPRGPIGSIPAVPFEVLESPAS